MPRFYDREDLFKGNFLRFEEIFLQKEGIENQNDRTFPQNEGTLLLFEGNSLDLREFSKKTLFSKIFNLSSTKAFPGFQPYFFKVS